MRSPYLLLVFRIALALLLANLSAQDAVKRDAHEMHRLHKEPKTMWKIRPNISRS